MGTWDSGLFDDDLAADVRDQYNQMVDSGKAPIQAAETVLDDYRNMQLDSDESVLLYICLAVLIRGNGIMDHQIIDIAKGYLKSGAGLERWQEAGSDVLKGRKRVYANLLAGMNAHHARRKLVRLPKAGDVFRMSLPGNLYGYGQYLGDDSTAPLAIVYDLVSTEPLSLDGVGEPPIMFGPVRCGINPPFREGRWAVLGQAPVVVDTHPKFLHDILDRDGVTRHWYLEDGNELEPLGTEIPPEYSHLERSWGVPGEWIERRILEVVESRRG